MKKWIGRISAAIVVILLVLWFGGKFYLSFSTADYSGDIELSGLTSNVEVNFDSMGVPQIYAENANDLYKALGWVHASERLFHMELIRRVAEGRLAELFGEDALEFDIFQRKIGFARKAFKEIQNLDSRNKSFLESYCDGINQWIDKKSVLPPEFVILQARPEKWTIEDIATIMLYQTWFAHYLMDHDKDYDRLINKLGGKVFDLVSKYKSWSPSTIKPEKDEISQYFRNYLMSFASNSMVVSPERSVSGKAIHESDPHLQINTVPGFWYIVGLHSSDGVNVLGITVPSIPFVVMGHNSNAAFAFTVASVDLIDYYKWKVNPKDSTQILTSDGYSKTKVVNEIIKIKDSDSDYSLDVVITPRGPVVETDSTEFTSLWWAGFDFNSAGIIRAGFELMSVKNFNEFRKVVTSLGALDVNWTYSDKKGNIGYQLGSPVPIRNYKNTYIKQNGEDSDKVWLGYLPLEETPFVFNPDEGFAATCNNQILPDNPKKSIPGFYDPYRIVRANELLKEKLKYDEKDIMRIQQDIQSVKAVRWKWLLSAGAKVLGENDLSRRIDDWDCKMKLNSDLAGIFSLWWNNLPKAVFEDELKDDYKLGGQILEETLSDSSSDFIDNKKTQTKVESLEDISAIALEEVLVKFGKPELGQISFHSLRHPLSAVKILDYWLNLDRGPYPIEGDNSTINANFMFFNDEENSFDASIGPSMRFILDWADVDNFKMITNLGQSGNPFSPHYDDFLDMMRNGKYWTIPFNYDKVKENTKDVLNLITKK